MGLGYDVSGGREWDRDAKANAKLATRILAFEFLKSAAAHARLDP